jgi:hypothetical protein
MVKEVHKVVKQSNECRLIIANSATSIDESNAKDVVVDGSHSGRNVGEMIAQAGVIGRIGNDAGVGRGGAGTAGLRILEKAGIPAAAVSATSALIGNGMSTYEEGIVSSVNEIEKSLGITVGMTAKEAADLMFQASLHGRTAATQRKAQSGSERGDGKRRQQEIVQTSGKSRIIVVNTTSDINEANINDVIVTGSHQGLNGGYYLSGLGIKGVIGNDAGLGKDNAGIAGLGILDEHCIPGAAVSSMSARIGNGKSTYHQGRLSAVNKTAEKLGLMAGMSAKEAAARMLDALAKK